MACIALPPPSEIPATVDYIRLKTMKVHTSRGQKGVWGEWGGNERPFPPVLAVSAKPKQLAHWITSTGKNVKASQRIASERNRRRRVSAMRRVFAFQMPKCRAPPLAFGGAINGMRRPTRGGAQRRPQDTQPTQSTQSLNYLC